MKRCYLAVIFLMLIADLPAQNFLEIEISGIRNSQGDILLQLYNEKHEIVDQRISAITGDSCKLKFEDLKPGRYALRYFHDENRSGKLELSRLGIPKEGFGYSNNAAARFGPPSFDKWLFNLSGNLKLELKITYLD
jgi:uncharacterized protein (DUF2141 family)